MYSPDYLSDLMVRMAHHSTAIEGNTLTQGETKSVLVDGYVRFFIARLSLSIASLGRAQSAGCSCRAWADARAWCRQARRWSAEPFSLRRNAWHWRSLCPALHRDEIAGVARKMEVLYLAFCATAKGDHIVHVHDMV